MKKAVFIDGNFWHGHDFPRLKERLKSEYWLSKIKMNMERDNKNANELRKRGWEILRVWEYDIKKDMDNSIHNIIMFLQ